MRSANSRASRKLKLPIFVAGTMVLIVFLLLFNFPDGSETTASPQIIVLVVIDALRADHLSCYGYQRETSPNIDSLAREALVFTQAITAGGWTGASVPSILTGVYPYLHEISEWNTPRKPEATTIAQLLKKKGFVSALFANHMALSMVDIMDGFEKTEIRPQDQMTSKHLVQTALDWIGERSGRPVFVYLHFSGAHSPYRPPEPYKSMFLADAWRFERDLPIDEDSPNDADRGSIPYSVIEDGITDAGYYTAQYDGAIAYADEQIGRLIAGLKRLGVYDRTFLLLTADHGELLGEHEIYFDHVGCYEANIRVPLVVKFPNDQGRGKTISRQVSLIDIAPTVLELSGSPIPQSIQGKSLFVLLDNDEEDLHPYVYTQKLPQTSVRGTGWKLISDGASSFLYDLINDPQETHDLAQTQKDRFDELKAVLEMHERQRVHPDQKTYTPVSEKEKRILRSLGYFR